MKKILCVVLVGILLLTAFTSCNDAADDPAQTAETTAAATTAATPEATTAVTTETTAATTTAATTAATTEAPPTLQGGSTSDFEYNENSNGGITLEKYIGNDTDVVIPQTINGKPVTMIGGWCFSRKFDLRSVTIPDSVTIISSCAFSQCTNLETVKLPSNLERLVSGVFEGSGITEISFPLTLKRVGYRTFADCKNLKEIFIPKGVIFEEEVFAYAGLEKITFEEGVEVIAQAMFFGTPIKEVVLPQSVKTIGNSAFADCANLESIVLNEGLITIDTYAFGGTSKLKEIIIPKTVVNMNEDAFYSCETMERVKFEGNAPADYVSGLPQMPNYTVYYHEGAEGFTSPEWCGYPTELW